MKDFIKPKKLNMIIDGQFGSTGKGLIASYIASTNHIDIACARLSPNAGHTFYYNNKKYITKHIPVAGIMSKRNMIYIGFGSVINPSILLKEIDMFDIDPDRIYIHPRTPVITEEILQEEKSSTLIKIASTLSGTGVARSSKILRTNPLASGVDTLKPFVKDIDLEDLLNQGCTALAETGQGFDLSLNVGYSYPYCTSTDITPSAILADFGLHPHLLGNVCMSIRTYPIRVGNPKDDNGKELGYSGPIYNDSEEVDFSTLNAPEEYTTVTRRKRRIFTFSTEQYQRSLKNIKPTHIFLNFINYLRERDLDMFKGLRKPTHVGYGPYTYQVCPWDKYILENSFYKR